MLLHFFGRGSAFADDNTCAYFKTGDTLVLLDFSQGAFPKFRDLDFSDVGRIFVLVTHTHGDHISGIGTMIHYAYYILKKPVTVIAPCMSVAEDMSFLLGKIEGCHPDGYKILTADAVREPWFIEAVPTQHAPTTHAGKCFGYALSVEDHYTLYTGDTNTLTPFLDRIASFGRYPDTLLYTEASTRKSDEHIFLDDHFDELLELCQRGAGVFLMHLNDQEAIRKKIAGTPLQIVPVIGR